MDLSQGLWKTVVEVSNSVHEAMQRDRMRKELKKYLHCDDEVKEMCRFASQGTSASGGPCFERTSVQTGERNS